MYRIKSRFFVLSIGLVEDFISKPRENNAHIHPTIKLSATIVKLAFNPGFKPSYYIAMA